MTRRPKRWRDDGSAARDEADIEYIEFPTGEQWVRRETEAKARDAIDPSDSTLFGSTSGKTTSITYLRWGKQTYANVRPCR